MKLYSYVPLSCSSECQSGVVSLWVVRKKTSQYLRGFYSHSILILDHYFIRQIFGADVIRHTLSQEDRIVALSSCFCYAYLRRLKTEERTRGSAICYANLQRLTARLQLHNFASESSIDKRRTNIFIALITILSESTIYEMKTCTYINLSAARNAMPSR